MNEELPVRNYVFKIEPDKGERLYAMFVGTWLPDPESDSELRYCLAAYRGGDLKLHYAMFVQVKLKGVMVLDEGTASEIGFRRLWRKFRNGYKEQFGQLYKASFLRFYEMETDRAETLFNSVVSAEA